MRTILSPLLFVALLVCVGFVTESAPQTAPDPAEGFYRLTKAAPAAFKQGERAKAKSIAESLLIEAEAWPKNWNYGNAIHVANLVLGRVALAAGEMDAARKFLLAAGKTPGSPQLNSFGPDMLFAREMIAKGETETVIAYFDLCAEFWKLSDGRLERWKAAVTNGDDPDFGPNLRYHF
jgi:hypothetical protein